MITLTRTNYFTAAHLSNLPMLPPGWAWETDDFFYKVRRTFDGALFFALGNDAMTEVAKLHPAIERQDGTYCCDNDNGITL